jgi:hypothetical protein
MGNLENDVKKAQLLSDEELKEVTGGGDPFAEIQAAMRKIECEGITKKAACESLSYCLWKIGIAASAIGVADSEKCVYRG